MKYTCLVLICVFVLCRSSSNCRYNFDRFQPRRMFSNSFPKFKFQPLRLGKLFDPFIHTTRMFSDIGRRNPCLSKFVDFKPLKMDLFSFFPFNLETPKNKIEPKEIGKVKEKSCEIKIDQPVDSPNTEEIEVEENEIYIIEEEEVEIEHKEPEKVETYKNERFSQKEMKVLEGVEISVEYEKYSEEGIEVEKERRFMGSRVMEIEKRDGVEKVRRFWNVDDVKEFQDDWNTHGFKSESKQFLSQKD